MNSSCQTTEIFPWALSWIGTAYGFSVTRCWCCKNVAIVCFVINFSAKLQTFWARFTLSGYKCEWTEVFLFLKLDSVHCNVYIARVWLHQRENRKKGSRNLGIAIAFAFVQCGLILGIIKRLVSPLVRECHSSVDEEEFFVELRSSRRFRLHFRRVVVDRKRLWPRSEISATTISSSAT